MENNNNFKEKEYYRSGEACKLLGITRTTLCKWIADGKLQSAPTMGKHNRIHHKDLINFINNNKVPLPGELGKSFLDTGYKYRVLIVDDDDNIINNIKDILKYTNINMEIKTANNGILAGIELIQFLPDLVILDSIMPGGNGEVVCKAIKERKMLRNTKILVFTGYYDEGEKLLKLGADEVIIKGSKDSDMDNFKKTICKLLGTE